MKAPKIHCRYTELWPIEKLAGKEHPQNPNKHPPAQLELYAKIIRGAGWRRPIVVSKRSGFITKGNGAYLAARLGGFKVVPVEIQNYSSKAVELADVLADNRLAELSDLDTNKTRALLEEMRGEGIGLDLTGYSPAELNDLFAPPKLEKLTVPNPPQMAWALIGVPITQFAAVQALLDKLPPGAKIETTANDQK